MLKDKCLVEWTLYERGLWQWGSRFSYEQAKEQTSSCVAMLSRCVQFWRGTGSLELERRERARDARGFQEELEDLLDKVAHPPVPPRLERNPFHLQDC